MNRKTMDWEGFDDQQTVFGEGLLKRRAGSRDCGHQLVTGGVSKMYRRLTRVKPLQLGGRRKCDVAVAHQSSDAALLACATVAWFASDQVQGSIGRATVALLRRAVLQMV